MSQAVDLEVFYPHPPERIWQVLTDRQALATWMMENDFEPRLGHRFKFYHQPLPGLQATILCEVVELEEPNRLAFTWKESLTAEPSLVVWTLTPVAGGTQLRLKHYQYSYALAVATPNRSNLWGTKHTASEDAHSYNSSKLFPVESLLQAAELKKSSHPSIPEHNLLASRARISATLEHSHVQAPTWNYFLNQRLPVVLSQNGAVSP